MEIGPFVIRAFIHLNLGEAKCLLLREHKIREDASGY